MSPMALREQHRHNVIACNTYAVWNWLRPPVLDDAGRKD